MLNKRKMATATARGGASPRVDTADTEGFGPVTVLLPCYLPNEQVRLYFYILTMKGWPCGVQTL